jgi:2'-5' RNA ligase
MVAAAALDSEERPTFFVCLRFTSESIKRQVEVLHKHAVSVDGRLREGFISSDALHITLAELRLVGTLQIEAAAAAVDEMAASMGNLATQPLQFSGLHHFRGRVLFTRPDPSSSATALLMQFAMELHQRLEAKGVTICRSIDEFTPHMTLLKLNRSMSRLPGLEQIPTRTFDCPFPGQKAGDPVGAIHFGSQAARSLHLCHMVPHKDTNHFYHCACSLLTRPASTEGAATVYATSDKAGVDYRGLSLRMQHADEHRQLLQRQATAVIAQNKSPWGAPAASSVLFVAVFLDEHSRQLLLDAVPPLHGSGGKIFANHVTLQFKPTVQQLCEFAPRLGQRVQVTVHRELTSPSVQAVAVSMQWENVSSSSSASGHDVLDQAQQLIRAHITISTANNCLPKLSVEALEKAAGGGRALEGGLVLEGKLGLKIRDKQRSQPSVLLQVSGEPLLQVSGPPPTADLVSTPRKPIQHVQAIYVFDLDGTLLNTPSATEANTFWQLANAVSHDSTSGVHKSEWPFAQLSNSEWLQAQESLDPTIAPISVGPAFAAFRSHLARSQQDPARHRTIIMTARPAALAGAVRRLLCSFGLALVEPQLGVDLIMKPDWQQPTIPFKVGALERLVAIHPALRVLKIFDDDEGNLESFRQYIQPASKAGGLQVMVRDARQMKSANPARANGVETYLGDWGLRHMGSTDAPTSYDPFVSHCLNTISMKWLDLVERQCEVGGVPLALHCTNELRSGGSALSSSDVDGERTHMADALVHTFGSFPLGAACVGGDIDLCVVGYQGGPRGTKNIYAAAVHQLAASLSALNSEDMQDARHSLQVQAYTGGAEARCPRLRLRFLQTTSSSGGDVSSGAPALEVDVVFALLPAEHLNTWMRASRTQLSMHVVMAIISAECAADPVVAMALEGPIFLADVKHRFARYTAIAQELSPTATPESIVSASIADVITSTKLLLCRHRMKGNEFHCMRSFHVVEMLARCCDELCNAVASESHGASAEWRETALRSFSVDGLFRLFMRYLSTRDKQEWTGLFGEFVPTHHVPLLQRLFWQAHDLIERQTVHHAGPESSLGPALLERVFQPMPFPPTGHTVLVLSLRMEDGSSDKPGEREWCARNYFEARLPTYTRRIAQQHAARLLPGGIAPADDGVDGICCAVPNKLLSAARMAFHELAAEVAAHFPGGRCAVHGQLRA